MTSISHATKISLDNTKILGIFIRTRISNVPVINRTGLEVGECQNNVTKQLHYLLTDAKQNLCLLLPRELCKISSSVCSAVANY